VLFVSSFFDKFKVYQGFLNMQFDRRQLEAFNAVASAGSFTAAARSLGLTVAAISLRVRALEEQAGKPLLLRAKRVSLTPAGQVVAASARQLALIEADLASALGSAPEGYQSVSVAINADSIASWVLPQIAPMLRQHRLLIDVLVDDQDHTMRWLAEGRVVGCISASAKPLRGCESKPLGRLRYRCLIAPSLKPKSKRSLTGPELVALPVVCFNAKDQLQDTFLAQHFGLRPAGLHRHFLGSVDAFHEGLLAGLGWGLESELHFREDFKSKRLVEAVPGLMLETPLYWHHWRREAPQAARLTQAVIAAGRRSLR
jgi:LysR family transcriptional regulator (chromosome initiation inhibitor)